MTKDKRVWVLSDFPEEDIATIQPHGSRHPKLDGKLRILRQHFPKATVETEPIEDWCDPEDFIAFRATVEDPETGRRASGWATADMRWDDADSLVENAESKALARALRWFGIGVGAADVTEMRPRRETEEVQQTLPESEEEPTTAEFPEGPPTATEGGGQGDPTATLTATQKKRLRMLRKKTDLSDEAFEDLLFDEFAALTLDDLLAEDFEDCVEALQAHV